MWQIGADGSRSKLRQLAGIHSIGWKYDQSAVVAKLDLANVRKLFCLLKLCSVTVARQLMVTRLHGNDFFQLDR